MLERPHFRYELALFALLILLFFAPHAFAAKSMVSAGYHDTFVLDSNGTLKVTGLNHYGMLGNDSMDEVHTFTTLSTIENVAYDRQS